MRRIYYRICMFCRLLGRTYLCGEGRIGLRRAWEVAMILYPPPKLSEANRRRIQQSLGVMRKGQRWYP
jgi:hypothetical protein